MAWTAQLRAHFLQALQNSVTSKSLGFPVSMGRSMITFAMRQRGPYFWVMSFALRPNRPSPVSMPRGMFRAVRSELGMAL
tara:strand:+ start:1503 stop:1742 length:240 start_codon:yes stop_codon:yes gene_type:complete